MNALDHVERCCSRVGNTRGMTALQSTSVLLDTRSRSMNVHDEIRRAVADAKSKRGTHDHRLIRAFNEIPMPYSCDIYIGRRFTQYCWQ